jgi:hypothetical protein
MNIDPRAMNILCNLSTAGESVHAPCSDDDSALLTPTDSVSITGWRGSGAGQVGGIQQVGDVSSSRKKPDSREFKLLLDGKKFNNPTEGMNEYWKLVKKVAKAQGVEIKEDSPGDVGARYVSFYDTPDHRLFDQGFIIRRRQDYPFDSATQPEKRECELVLKFRNKNIDVAASKDVSIAEGLKGGTSLDEDVAANKKDIVDLFAHSGWASVPDEPRGNLGDYARVFPGLSSIGIDDNTPIDQVNGFRVKELTMRPGRIKLSDGQKAKVLLSVWFRQDEKGNQEPLIAEFSFDFKTKKGPMDKFMKTLQRETASWTADVPYHTKTELAYSR